MKDRADPFSFSFINICMLHLAYILFFRIVKGALEATADMVNYNVDKIEQTAKHGTDWITDFSITTGSSDNIKTGQPDLYFNAHTADGKRAICSLSTYTKKGTNAFEQNVQFLANRFGCLPYEGDQFTPEEWALPSPTPANLQVFNSWVMAMGRVYEAGIRVDLFDDGVSDNLSIRFPEKAEAEHQAKLAEIDSDSINTELDALLAVPEPEPATEPVS